MNFVIAAEVAGKVPGISLACMTFSALLMVAFPMACILFFRSRMDADIKEVIFGALAYVVISLLLVNVLYMLVSAIPGVNSLLKSNTALLVIANMILVIVPEVGALALFLGRRSEKKQNLGTYLEFAAGYVTVELIVVAGTVMMTNLAIAGAYNDGGIEALMEMTGAEAGSDFSYLVELINMPFYAYLFSALEGCLFAAIRICFMVLMYMIYRKILPGFYYAVIMGLYVLVKLPSALADLGVLADSLVDPFLLLICAGELIWLFRVIGQGLPEEIKPLIRKPDLFYRRKKSKPKSPDQGFH